MQKLLFIQIEFKPEVYLSLNYVNKNNNKSISLSWHIYAFICFTLTSGYARIFQLLGL